MIKLSFHQTRAEQMVRAAATVIFNELASRTESLAPLSEICHQPQYGFTASASFVPVGPKFVRITDLEHGHINWDSVPYCKCHNPGSYLLRQDDLLFARTGATTGKTHILGTSPEAIFASYLIRVRPKEGIVPRYLYSFFQSDGYWGQLIDEKKGSAQPNVNGKKLMRLFVPKVDKSIQISIAQFLEVVRMRGEGSTTALPELPSFLQKQRRIVARIEELSAKIEEAHALRDQASMAASLSVTSLHLQMARGRTIRLDQILALDEHKEPVQYGRTYPQVGVKGFGQGLFARETLDATETTYRLFNRLYEGALVLSQVKGWEGAVAICGQALAGRYVSPEYRTFRCISGKAAPRYLAALVGTPWFWTRLKDITRGVGARRERTRPEQFLSMELPMPTEEQQQKAVPLLEKLDIVKRLQAETTTELNALMPSILSRAFAGEL